MASTKLRVEQTSFADGWVPITDTWTYASASTITVPSGAASRYGVGDRIKWTQTTVKYGVIVAVADTLLTIAVNTDYVLANAAISSISYSHQMNPVGYPHWFNYTSTVNWSSTPPTTPTTIARFCVNGRTCHLRWSQDNTGAGTTNASVNVSLPITSFDQTAGYIIAGGGRISSTAIGDNAGLQANKGVFIYGGVNAVYMEFASISAKSAAMAVTYQI